MRRLFYLLVIPLTTSFFTEDFASFIEENYGENFLDLLQRKDLGETGSFGGRNSPDEELQNDPVIFIHGISDTAGEKIKNIADKFAEIGYTEGELYGTSYSNGAGGNPIAWTQYSMRCEYVKQVRALILAVRYYTRKDVDVVAFSLGVPIARKAILGFCVDSDEELGGSLTKYIDTFVGIAGPNHGIALKVGGVPVPACVLGAPPICDRIVGLYSGLCPLESMFLNDINRKEHYEGKYVYSIYSQADHLVGYRVCDKVTASIPGEDGHKVFASFDHDEILLNSFDYLFSTLQNHTTFVQSRQAIKSKVFGTNFAKITRRTEAATAISPPVATTAKIATHSDEDIVKTLESIFIDTKASSLQSIRNFFRQKFADENFGEGYDQNDQLTQRRQSHRQPLKSTGMEDGLDVELEKEQKKAQGSDRINHQVGQKNEAFADIEIPFMVRRQVQQGDGYHTVVRLQLDES